MDIIKLLEQEDDWHVLLTFLPSGWQEKAVKSGALVRNRKFTAETLLRTLLIHLAEGCSLRETAVRAKLGGVANVSDVALLKRLKASGEWLRWMASELMAMWITKQPSFIYDLGYRIRIIDGSTIQEPGATGSSWRLHYSIELPQLRCDEVYVTEPVIGESFKQFSVKPKDLFIGDRGFGNRNSVRHVVENGGAVLVRINATNLPLKDKDNKFDLLTRLRTLKKTQAGDWDVLVPYDNSTHICGRLCAIKKSKEAAERARRKAIQESSKKGHVPKPETIEIAEYVMVFTTLESKFKASTILEMYRGRWQIELIFKRLKSILGLGHLKKIDPEGAKAWIHGKLFVAFLIEALVSCGESFFPWGYPLPPELAESMPLERNSYDGTLA